MGETTTRETDEKPDGPEFRPILNPPPIMDGPDIHGLLSIGDQHLKSEPPGRRMPGYANAILNKIDHVIGIANEKLLLPLFLGDMFDGNVEADEGLKVRLIRILRKSWIKPVVNTGNHDTRNGATLSDGDSLAYIGESGVVHLMTRPGVAGVWRLAGLPVGKERSLMVAAIPYGFPIPLDIRNMGPADARVLLTHDDLKFDGAYSKAKELHAIEGCDILLNGHMHTRVPSIRMGKTMLCNFGSIARDAVDRKDNVPIAVQIDKGGKFFDHVLPHLAARDAFDLEGRHVQAASTMASVVHFQEQMQAQAPSVAQLQEQLQERLQARAAEQAFGENQHSAFVDVMKQDMSAGRATSSGAKIEEDLNLLMAEMKISRPGQAMVTSLLRSISSDPAVAESMRLQVGRDMAALEAARAASPEEDKPAPTRRRKAAPASSMLSSA